MMVVTLDLLVLEGTLVGLDGRAKGAPTSPQTSDPTRLAGCRRRGTPGLAAKACPTGTFCNHPEVPSSASWQGNVVGVLPDVHGHQSPHALPKIASWEKSSMCPGWARQASRRSSAAEGRHGREVLLAEPQPISTATGLDRQRAARGRPRSSRARTCASSAAVRGRQRSPERCACSSRVSYSDTEGCAHLHVMTWSRPSTKSHLQIHLKQLH